MTSLVGTDRPDPDALAVELVHWPRERARRDALARAGVPRLLLVAVDEHPPVPLTLGEDWIRVPADERDLHARASRLQRLSSQTRAEPPVLDADTGWLHRGGRRIMLSRGESDVLAMLLEQPGRVASRDELESVIWPDGAPSARALDSLLYRLRRRVKEVGVVVLSSRGRGFLVDGDSVASEPPAGPSA